ncbi:S8 family serine peptidase [Microbulbifer hydrolyticus]|uniref:S8 family serine peptidase n=1 Tax=Microbulbifer hydrolyticus TaxID=48074 RepID=A0A6P1T8T7_9GAMM|nr:S8 family serine peptidase [Microbulbifer hydrolyticus]MBB5211258.1 serine protease [Microbulbifer hydrolyticus]QHQ37976.1 S8 family serine peptidase [Microbulbifer hydrolyticus]
MTSASSGRDHRDTAAALSRIAGADLRYRRSLFGGEFDVLRLQQRLPENALQQLIRTLEKQPGVLSVEVDRMMQHTAVPNDSRYSEQWHYFEATGGINLETAWDTHDGSGVVVAVIDTGITDHSDLNANVIRGYDFIGDTAVANDGNGRDNDPSDPGDWLDAWECGFFNPSQPRNSSWHGTHVAGTIAAVTGNGQGVAGIAPGAKVLVARVLGKCGGYTSDIIDAIVWSSGGTVSGVPANANPAQVINLSLGGQGSCGAAMQSAIDTARANGTTVVIAAGNSNADAANYAPANCNGVVTVAATDRQGNRASYSNYGDSVEISAPGGETNTTANGILSTLNSGSQGPVGETYRHYQGTSMAAPHVAGVAALLYQANPALSPNQVIQAIQDTARAVPGSCSGGCGAGIIDARAALDAVSGGNRPPTAQFGCTSDALTLSCTDQSGDSDGNITRWAWDFGDGNTSAQQSPEHTYASGGTYEVTLTVTDDEDASDSSRQSFDISGPVQNQAPDAGFDFTTSGLGVDFTDTSSDSDGTVNSWRWEFGDGTSSSAQNPSHNFASPDTYTVTLTVTDNENATDSISRQVTVSDPAENAPPEADFTVSISRSTASFTDNSSDSDGTIQSWSWDFGDGGSSNAQNPSHEYTQNGTYRVTLTVTDNDGASHSVTREVTATCQFRWGGRCFF